MKRLLIGSAVAALLLSGLTGCGYFGGAPAGADQPPMDGGARGAAYLACRERAIQAGVLTPVTETVVDAACAEQAAQVSD